MTQELIDKLIAHHEGVIEEIEADPNNMESIIRKTNTACGICACALEEFKTDIYGDKWVKSKEPFIGYWAALPSIYITFDEIIECLQVRVDIMKTFSE